MLAKNAHSADSLGLRLSVLTANMRECLLKNRQKHYNLVFFEAPPGVGLDIVTLLKQLKKRIIFS